MAGIKMEEKAEREGTFDLFPSPVLKGILYAYL